MKRLQNLIASMMLVAALAAPAFAGSMYAGVATPDPSPTPSTAPAAASTNPADAQAPASATSDAGDSALAQVVQAALTVVQGVLSIL